MDAYRSVVHPSEYLPIQLMASNSKGLTAKQVEYAVTKYRSHRRIGPTVMMSLGMLDNPA